MRNIYKKTVSLLLAVMLLLSMTAVGVMAESAAPTEVKNCTYSGFDSTLNISFEDSAKAWLNAITDVTANGVTYTKGTVSWGAEGNLWNIGTVSGAYGDEQALKLLYSSGSFPSTIVVKANGYDTVTLNVTSESSGYKATITTAEPTAAPTASPTPEPTPVEDKDPPTDYTTGSGSASHDFQLTFNNATDWTQAITGIEINGEAWTESDRSYEVSQNKVFYIGNSGRVLIGEGFEGDTATCIIKATGYKPLTLTLGKTNYSAVLNVAYDKTKSADANDVTLEYRYGDWIIGFKNPADYVGNVLDFKVNGISWAHKSTAISGGAYSTNASANTITIAETSYSTSSPAVKSGDVITISAKGYEDLNLKFVVDKDGKASLVADDGKGDPLELHVKIEGSFEAAIVGQRQSGGNVYGTLRFSAALFDLPGDGGEGQQVVVVVLHFVA